MFRHCCLTLARANHLMCHTVIQTNSLMHAPSTCMISNSDGHCICWVDEDEQNRQHSSKSGTGASLAAVQLRCLPKARNHSGARDTETASALHLHGGRNKVRNLQACTETGSSHSQTSSFESEPVGKPTTDALRRNDRGPCCVLASVQPNLHTSTLLAHAPPGPRPRPGGSRVPAFLFSFDKILAITRRLQKDRIHQLGQLILSQSRARPDIIPLLGLPSANLPLLLCSTSIMCFVSKTSSRGSSQTQVASISTCSRVMD
jgi:hypothetical protein